MTICNPVPAARPELHSKGSSTDSVQANTDSNMITVASIEQADSRPQSHSSSGLKKKYR